MGKIFEPRGMAYATGLAILLLLVVCKPLPALGDMESGEAVRDAVVGASEPGEEDDWLDEEGFEIITVFDPFEPINRVFFNLNDKLYFWLLRPVGRGYGFVVPKPASVSCIYNDG